MYRFNICSRKEAVIRGKPQLPRSNVEQLPSVPRSAVGVLSGLRIFALVVPSEGASPTLY
jgi:hypothetical protein